jgi:hypothetical protein
MRARSDLVRTLVRLAVAVTVSATAADAASCDATGADAAAVSSARAAVRAACDCAGAYSAALRGRCVRDALRTLVAGGLSRGCEREVRRGELRSTCGRADRRVCCRTSASGKTAASLRRHGACLAPSGGSSCESVFPHLDEGCRPGGCALPAPVCGNGVIEAGEACDPPNGATCSATCAQIPLPVCGNGTVEPGESCDPPNGTTCSASCQVVVPPVCGNGAVEAGESCDPPNGTTCSATCAQIPPPACGNRIVEAGESCDPPDRLTCGNDCAPCPGPGCWEPAGQTRFCGNGPVTPQCSFLIPTPEACAAEGGCWESHSPRSVCNCPTLDSGKPCTSQNDCEGFCISDSCRSTDGACTDRFAIYECLCFVDSPSSVSYWCADPVPLP